ncbi:MAG: AbrB/MazE/SpoVT family DNA-binding domain-containing protein [Chloroflexota bacterium]
MRELVTSLTQRGQVTTPAEIRARLGLKPRDKVIFELDAEAVRLRPTASNVRRHFGVVPPLDRPEDFQELRVAFEEGVAREVASQGK